MPTKPIALIRTIYSTRLDSCGNSYHVQAIARPMYSSTIYIDYCNEPSACTYSAREAGGYEVHTTEVQVTKRELDRLSAEALPEHLAEGAVWRLLSPEHGAPGLALRLHSLLQEVVAGVEAENDGSLSELARYGKTNGARIAREELERIAGAFGASCDWPGIYPWLTRSDGEYTMGDGEDAALSAARWLYRAP